MNKIVLGLLATLALLSSARVVSDWNGADYSDVNNDPIKDAEKFTRIYW